MNKILKRFGVISACAMAMTACSPDEFDGADPANIPTIQGKSIKVVLDEQSPTTNTATLSIEGDMTNCYPAWYLMVEQVSEDGNDTSYVLSESPSSILPTFTYENASAGKYKVAAKIVNRNGISQAYLSTTFSFRETKIDYTPTFNKLVGKTWRVDYTIKGHLGCGEPGSDGGGWWSAGLNEKADNGIYDDRIEFSHSDSDPVNGGTYSYNPGEDGLLFVNAGVTAFGGTQDADFDTEVQPQETTFTIVSGEYNGEECIYLQFPAKTLFPYIPNDATYENPIWRVESLSSSQLALVADEGTIAWRLVLTSKEDTGLPEEPEVPEEVFDWDYNSDANLWKSVDAGDDFVGVSPWFANSGWAQIDDPEWTQDGNVWEVIIPEGMGGDQWQGQFPISTTLSASMTKKYNLYLLVDSDDDIPGLTIKFTQSGGGDADNNFFTADRHAVTGGKQFVFKGKEMVLPQGDADALTLFFDFGGTPAGTTVKISNIFFEEVAE